MAMPERAQASTRRLYVAEPPSHYAQRAPAVVDASLIAALLFAEAGQSDARERLARCQPVAPGLLPYEMANVAVNKLRRGLAEAAVRASLADLHALGIELHPIDATEALNIAARHGLTAYDAAYLALAAHLRCPLYTFDRRLAEAAQRHLGERD
jgi:predicted nucleic acid-binding protein